MKIILGLFILICGFLLGAKQICSQSPLPTNSPRSIEIFFMPQSTLTRIPVDENKIKIWATKHIIGDYEKNSELIKKIEVQLVGLKKSRPKYKNIRILAKIKEGDRIVLQIESGNAIWINGKSYVFDERIHKDLECIVFNAEVKQKK